MPEINQNNSIHPELAKHLNEYINAKHTQEECVGFSDGFKKANELANENKKLIISKLNEMTLNYEDGQDLERQILELIKNYLK